MNDWNNLGNIIKSSDKYLTFRKRFLALIRPKCNETCGIHHPTGLKLLTCLQSSQSHLDNYKFNHNCRDCINPLYSRRLSLENNVHFFHFSLQRQTLMNNIKSVDKDIINETDSDFVNVALFGSNKYEYHINSKILNF